jgi:hypothetical protein
MLSPTLRYIHPSLGIPADVQAVAFPDATLSVLDFLQFPLPIISGATSCHKTSEFFSTEWPTAQDIKTIQKIPIPLANTVVLLVTGCKAAVLSRVRSVKCPHAPSASAQSLPMWVILYWAEILELRKTP